MIPFSPTGIAEDAVTERSRRAVARGDHHRMVAGAIRQRRAAGSEEVGRIRQAIGRRLVDLGMWIGNLRAISPVIEKN